MADTAWNAEGEICVPQKQECVVQSGNLSGAKYLSSIWAIAVIYHDRDDRDAMVGEIRLPPSAVLWN